MLRNSRLGLNGVCIVASLILVFVSSILFTIGVLISETYVQQPSSMWDGFKTQKSNVTETITLVGYWETPSYIPEYADTSLKSLLPLGILTDVMSTEIQAGNGLNYVSGRDYFDQISRLMALFCEQPSEYDSMSEYLQAQCAPYGIDMYKPISRLKAAQCLLKILQSTVNVDLGVITNADLSELQYPSNSLTSALRNLSENGLMIGYSDQNLTKSLVDDKLSYAQLLVLCYNTYSFSVDLVEAR